MLEILLNCNKTVTKNVEILKIIEKFVSMEQN